MSQYNAPDPNTTICITETEAHSSHVDDLLRRQASLRGEPGIRDSGRKWYYQNWFILMFAGLIAAVAGSALSNPSSVTCPTLRATSARSATLVSGTVRASWPICWWVTRITC